MLITAVVSICHDIFFLILSFEIYIINNINSFFISPLTNPKSLNNGNKI